MKHRLFLYAGLPATLPGIAGCGGGGGRHGPASNGVYGSSTSLVGGPSLAGLVDNAGGMNRLIKTRDLPSAPGGSSVPAYTPPAT